MKRITTCLFLLLTGLVFAQEKQLDLKATVLNQWTTFYPETRYELQWIKGLEAVSYRKVDQAGYSLYSFDANTGKESKVLDVTALNENKLGLSFRMIPFGIQWLNSNEFMFQHESNFYTYNLDGKSLTQVFEQAIPEGAENVDLAHEGKAVAFTVDNNLSYLKQQGSAQNATSNDNPDIVSGQAIHRSEFGITEGIFWSPKGNLLAFYQKDESEVTSYPLLDISSTPGSLKSIKYPMAGQGSEMAKVGITDMSTGKTIYLKTKGEKDHYLTNLGWSPDERFIYLAEVNRDQNHMKLNWYEAKTGKLINTLFEEKHEKYVEPEQPVHFVPNDPTKFLWFSERDGYNHLYLYDTHGEGKQLTKGDWVALEILGFNEKGNVVYVKGTSALGLEQHCFAVNLKSEKRTDLTPENGVHNCQISTSGNYILDDYSNRETPRIICIRDRKGKVVHEILSAKNPLQDYATGEMEFVSLKAEDGTPLHGRMIKPSHFDPSKKYPVFVYVYGGPHAQMITESWLGGANLWMYWMAEQGFIVFTLDNRGSANRGLAFENVIHRQAGEAEMNDQLVGLNYLKGLPFVDADRCAVHGWSYGGFMATSLMLKRPGNFQVAIAGGPVTDWKYYEVMYGERYMDTPQDNPEGYKKTSLLPLADQLDGDLLLIHGTIDNVVVMQHNLALVQAFIKAGKQIDFFPYPGHEHNVYGPDRYHLMHKILHYAIDKLEVE